MRAKKREKKPRAQPQRWFFLGGPPHQSRKKGALRKNPGPLNSLEGAKNFSRGAKKARKNTSRLKYTREKISVPLAGINIITPQTGFFVPCAKKTVQKNEFSWYLEHAKIGRFIENPFFCTKIKTSVFSHFSSPSSEQAGQRKGTPLIRPFRIAMLSTIIRKCRKITHPLVFAGLFFVSGRTKNKPHLAARVLNGRRKEAKLQKEGELAISVYEGRYLTLSASLGTESRSSRSMLEFVRFSGDGHYNADVHTALCPLL